jgi:hypothetical protein
VVNVAAVNVLAGLGTASWTVSRGVEYETVLEGVRQSIGFYSQLIAAEELSDQPDADKIELWRAEQLAWTKRGQEVTPLDTRAIASIHADADDLLSLGDDEDDDAAVSSDADSSDADSGDADSGDADSAAADSNGGTDGGTDDEMDDEAQGRP